MTTFWVQFPLMWCPFSLSSGVWRSRVYKIPGSSHRAGLHVRKTQPVVALFVSQLFISLQHRPSINQCAPVCVVSGWSLEAALWANTTSLQPKTWPTLQSLRAPPPPPPPPTTRQLCSSAARSPGTSWSSRTSRTTTTLWTALSETD